jgi:hypothetical protein
MGIDYLILIFLLKLRESLFGKFASSESDEYVIKDYDQVISESIVCDAPQEVPHKRKSANLHLVK